MAVNPPHPEQRRILTEFCETEIDHQVAYLIKRYGLVGYDPSLYLSWRTNATASYGGELEDGEPYVELLLFEVWDHVGKSHKLIFDEYEFLHNVDGIGMGEANWKQHIAWTMAHELAHTIVEIERFKNAAKTYFPPRIANSKDTNDGHGLLWQAIYRDLRVNFCTEDRYEAEEIDFSKAVHFSHRWHEGVQRYTYYRGGRAVAWYVREDGVFYRSSKKWSRMTPTLYKKPSEIRRKLASV